MKRKMRYEANIDHGENGIRALSHSDHKNNVDGQRHGGGDECDFFRGNPMAAKTVRKDGDYVQGDKQRRDRSQGCCRNMLSPNRFDEGTPAKEPRDRYQECDKHFGAPARPGEGDQTAKTGDEQDDADEVPVTRL